MKTSLHFCTALILVISFALSGCMVGPNYKRPEIAAPPVFRGEAGAQEQASLADLPWWAVFKDETLQALIRQALTNNYDLRIAVSRVEQARQIAAQAKSLYYPNIEYQGNISTGKNLLLGVPTSTGEDRVDSLLLVINAAWEIDFWGKFRRANEAARAQLYATEEFKRGVMLILVSDVAVAYFELLELDLELEIAHSSTQSFEESLKIFTQRLEQGVASKLETSRAEAALASTAASIPELERQIALKENQINVLLGRNPAPITRNATLLQEEMPVQIPVGLPSELLERRPDVRTAELNLISANAQIGVAKANFFPRIGLTALFGSVSPELTAFTSGTTALGVAAGLAGPIISGGRLKAEYRQAIAIWEEFKLQYESTTLNAFQEVSNALITREKLEGVRKEQARAVAALQESVKVSTLRYIAGKAGYFEVLEAQQQLFPAQNLLAQTDLNRLLVVVQLYQALGGGWNLTDDQWLQVTPTSATNKSSQ
jgi:multidrug efflux system outer membrane protein